MRKLAAVFVPLISALSLNAVIGYAQQAPVNLGSDAGFVIVAGTTVTVTGGGAVSGDIGIFPGTAYVPGTPAVTVNGTVYQGGPVAAQAQSDLAAAYQDAAGRSVAPVTLSGNIGGQTLAPGLYKSTSSLAISSGDLTLDAQGNANAVWIFQIASTLTTTSGRQVILAGGADASNIFWQVGTSATLGTTSVFHGNILAAVSVSVLTGATLDGRALAQSGAVTVDTGGADLIAVPKGVSGAPSISVSGVVNDASFVTPVVAGSIAAVFGVNLSIGQLGSTDPLPLSNTLAQSSFVIGGHATPMYFASPGQVNLQIPWELSGQTQTQITATVAASESAAQNVVLAAFAPGIYTLNQSGAGQGAILLANTSTLASAGTPASRGSYISIFCTGLGAVTNPPATGFPATSSPLSYTVTQATATIGGLPAIVSYSGLAPSLVGLYQVNALVPAGVTPGSAVAVVIEIGGVTSNTATIGVQ